MPLTFLKRGCLVLAPMAGFTNSVCRKLFRQYGADATVSEFVHSRAVLSRAERVLEKVRLEADERPAGVQIFSSDPAEAAEAASLIEDIVSPDFLDINFGCPAPAAVKAGAGSALLRDVKKMADIVQAVSGALKRTPVTAKMRTGWSSSEIVLPDAALRLQDAGARMITIHGRTKAQGYSGECNWDIIERTARAVGVPVIGNGSVELLTAGQMAESACLGFMVGRAALGNPWIFPALRARMSGSDGADFRPTPADRARLALKYAEFVCAHGYAAVSAENLTLAKAQIMCFLKNAEGFKRVRAALRDIKSFGELELLITKYLKEYE